jgi:diadenosine tetraphosphatase ApaH/serine/threonine PP2A family protein phosphatase
VKVGHKYFINVGSVGQPRDNDPRSAYVIYDMIENQIELRRLEYDLEKTQKKILDRGLPQRLAARLAQGR